MSDLRELYQQQVVDHSKNPRNKGVLESANRSADGFNPLCGDKVKIFIELEGDVIRKATFDGVGCAISTASASMMTEALVGKTEAEANRIFQNFHEMVTGRSEGEPDLEKMGKLAVFSGVSEYPMRVKCATLAWHTLQAALIGAEEPACTE